MTILYVVGGIVVLLFLMQYLLILKMRFKKGKPVPDLGERYAKFVDSGKKTVFYFFSPGCRACVQMTPIINRLAKTHRNILKIDVSKDMQLAKKMGVMGTPSTVLIESGKIRDFMVGPQTHDKLLQFLNHTKTSK